MSMNDLPSAEVQLPPELQAMVTGFFDGLRHSADVLMMRDQMSNVMHGASVAGDLNIPDGYVLALRLREAGHVANAAVWGKYFQQDIATPEWAEFSAESPLLVRDVHYTVGNGDVYVKLATDPFGKDNNGPLRHVLSLRSMEEFDALALQLELLPDASS